MFLFAFELGTGFEGFIGLVADFRAFVDRGALSSVPLKTFRDRVAIVVALKLEVKNAHVLYTNCVKWPTNCVTRLNVQQIRLQCVCDR